MKHALHLKSAMAVLAGFAMVAPAQAQMPETAPIAQDELIKAWKAICYDNTLDTAAQIKVATSAAYAAVRTETDAQGNQTYVGPKVTVFIRSRKDLRYCAVAAVLDAKPDDAAAITYINGLAGTKPEMEGTRAFWVMEKKDHTFTIGFGSGTTVDGRSGMLIGSGADLK